jgi:hypothetical protein
MHTKPIKNDTPLHLHICFLKRGAARQDSRGVCNLICRSLFHYYSDYPTSFPSLYTSFPLCASFPLCISSVLPLYTFLVCFLLREERDRESVRINRLAPRGFQRRRKRERVGINRLAYLLCFLKKEEERGRETLASSFTRVFKIDYTCDLQDP